MKLKVAKSGKQIDSTVLDDFFLHSDYPVLKIHSFGSFSFPVAIGSINITHNLGYLPYAIVFSQVVDEIFSAQNYVSTEYYQLPYYIDGATKFIWGKADITTTQVQISVQDTNVFRGGTVHGFYYIFKDRMDST